MHIETAKAVLSAVADALRLMDEKWEYVEHVAFEVCPSSGDLAEQTFDWVLWLEEDERRLVWSRAARVPWKQITVKNACDRTTAWQRHKLALTKIAARLNAR
jgi:hypothetical protein